MQANAIVERDARRTNILVSEDGDKVPTMSLPHNKLEITDEEMHVTRQALHYAINVLDRGAREVVLEYFEQKHALSLYEDIAEIPREDVTAGFQEFFGAGAGLLLRRYNYFLGLPSEVKQMLIGFMR